MKNTCITSLFLTAFPTGHSYQPFLSVILPAFYFQPSFISLRHPKVVQAVSHVIHQFPFQVGKGNEGTACTWLTWFLVMAQLLRSSIISCPFHSASPVIFQALPDPQYATSCWDRWWDRRFLMG
jgi:hypothetical protein